MLLERARSSAYLRICAGLLFLGRARCGIDVDLPVRCYCWTGFSAS
jgi:hypothetical protein